MLRPRAVDDAGFTVTRREEGGRVYFQVRGTKPERWVRQTQFSNDEAVGYLADRLARMGVEDALFKAGAVAGAEVVIGDGDDAVVFDWEPTLMTGSELLGGPRGSDLRLEDSARPDPLGQAPRVQGPDGRQGRGARGAVDRARGRHLDRRRRRAHPAQHRRRGRVPLSRRPRAVRVQRAEGGRPPGR